MTEPGPASECWRDELAAWTIPEEILAAAPESPWGFPVALFRAHAHQHDNKDDEDAEPSPSQARAAEALPAGGEVLDVGCGGGRASLALAPPAGSLTGVDSLTTMLEAFAEAAEAKGLRHHEIEGNWPDVAGQVAPADVVVCHHVAYNVPEFGPFATALSEHARRRVVLELTDRHPLVATGPLWEQFHGLARPDGPTAELACDVLREHGIEPAMERFVSHRPLADRAEIVAFTRRRLCLPADRDPEVDAALGPDWGAFRELVTLWWDV